jgi:colanic acid/amylovoran biosynthesis glycosyltransferase
MRAIAVFVNQYPKASHAFIRREILELERQGQKVFRVALRGWDLPLPDAADQLEQTKTHYLLSPNAFVLFTRALQAIVLGLLKDPAACLKSFATALSLAQGNPKTTLKHFFYWAEGLMLAHWCRRNGVGHVHAHFGTNSAMVAMLCKLAGGPSYSFTVHGPEEFDSPLALKLSVKAKHSKFVRAISSYGRAQLQRWLDISDWPKVCVIRCGLEPSWLELPIQHLPSSNRIVCVGRLCEQKGQLTLIQALSRLKGKGISFELVLAGDGEMRPQIEGAIKAHGLGNCVHITGWVSTEQVIAQMNAAKLLVLPSFAEGLPVVLMEAMALGRPVISTYVAGIPELVEPGVNGWLCPAGDSNSLAQCLEPALACEPSQLTALGINGRAKVFSQHNLPTEMRNLVSAINRDFS